VTPTTHRSRRALLGLLGLLAAASIAAPATGDEPVAGSAGVDTSLPATESAVTVSGRGRFADLRLTVNQTQDLVNQAVSVTWSGAQPTTRGSSRFDGHYLQIMQCWGDDDGTNPENPGPPPEQCVQGATDAVYGGRNQGIFPAGGSALERIISRTDFPGFDPGVGFVDERTTYVWRPFRAVDGTVVDAHYDPDFNPAVVGGSYWLNPYFNAITTNEVAGGRTGPNGTGAELFEVTTGLESAGLGCGQKVQPVPGGEPKTPRCWLVIVPRGDPETENDGTPFAATSGVFTSPLAPEAWTNRIAVPLEFTPLDSACALADEQRRISGNELPVPAVTSWQQQLCTTPDLPPYAYGPVGDSAARQQLLTGGPGGPGMVAVSRPIEPETISPTNPVVYAPLTLSGTVIGFNIERTPKVVESNPEEESLRGIRIAELNLTPRLVAKLLTQSYRLQTAIKSPTPYEWAKTNPPHMGADPDFLRFNPEFELLENGGKNFGGLVMPARDSDAARQVWEWVLADPEATAWLGGAADPWGMQVNPAYSTDPARNSTGAAFGDPVPEQFPKSDPYCYQAPPQGVGGAVVPPPLCGTDWLPYTQSLRDAARLTRAADDGARTSEDQFAVSSDKVYRPNVPQTLGSRTILSLTDTASAYQYGVQMARLSRAGDDGDERTFIAPDVAGLTAGVEAMVPEAGSQWLEPDPTVTAPGAYPLTALTYAAVTPLALDDAARQDYATFLEYAAGPGQVVGRELGQLPPGYAPLPPVLQAEAVVAAALVRELEALVEDPTPSDDPPEPADEASPPAPVAGDAPGAPVDFGSRAPAAPALDTGPPADGGVSTPTVVTPETSAPEASGLLTPIVAVASSRLALPGLGAMALFSALGSLEITKRPRRLPADAVAQPAGDHE
jgi:hypothetical protein